VLDLQLDGRNNKKNWKCIKATSHSQNIWHFKTIMHFLCPTIFKGEHVNLKQQSIVLVNLSIEKVKFERKCEDLCDRNLKKPSSAINN
jgi:hypothetical protein